MSDAIRPCEGPRRDRDALRAILESADIQTPAMVFDESALVETARNARRAADLAGCRLCYSLKACSTIHVVRLLAEWVDGFSCSSLFEAKLATALKCSGQTVHFTSPGLRDVDRKELFDICGFVAFNSLSQFERCLPDVSEGVRCGLRLNPGLSLVDDERYDPCRTHSKLGINLDEIAGLFQGHSDLVEAVDGLHFHTNCDSESFEPLLRTVKRLDEAIPEMLAAVRWVNMGGGYWFGDDYTYEALCEAVDLLRSKYDLEVFIEPGGALARDAGFLVGSVVDLFVRDGKPVAVLDASVNHMPEVFEYEWSPDVADTASDGYYGCLLAGASCLAGDVFGEYFFESPVYTGRRVIIEQAGAYSLVKAHQFNGIDLPNLYALTQDGRMELIKTYGYDDFVTKCGGDVNAVT